MSEPGGDTVESILIGLWFILSAAVCGFAGKGFASYLLKEPQSYERLLSYRRKITEVIIETRKENESELIPIDPLILLDPDRDMYGVMTDPLYIAQLCGSADDRIRAAAESLRDEESYRRKRKTLATVAAVLVWLMLNGLMIELG